MDASTFLLGLLTGVVVFAFLPFAVLLVVAVAEILLNPGVAHAPEISQETESENVREQLAAEIAETDELIREIESELGGQ